MYNRYDSKTVTLQQYIADKNLRRYAGNVGIARSTILTIKQYFCGIEIHHPDSKILLKYIDSKGNIDFIRLLTEGPYNQELDTALRMLGNYCSSQFHKGDGILMSSLADSKELKKIQLKLIVLAHEYGQNDGKIVNLI